MLPVLMLVGLRFGTARVGLSLAALFFSIWLSPVAVVVVLAEAVAEAEASLREQLPSRLVLNLR
jgi:hypothetical protein